MRKLVLRQVQIAFLCFNYSCWFTGFSSTFSVAVKCHLLVFHVWWCLLNTLRSRRLEVHLELASTYVEIMFSGVEAERHPFTPIRSSAEIAVFWRGFSTGTLVISGVLIQNNWTLETWTKLLKFGKRMIYGSSITFHRCYFQLQSSVASDWSCFRIFILWLFKSAIDKPGK